MFRISIILAAIFPLWPLFGQDTTFLTTYGGISQDQGRSIVQTYDGGFLITGSTSSFGYGNTDVYLVKTDSAGTYLWSKTFGGSNVDWGMSLKETGDRGIIIAGYTNSFGSGGYDVYLIRTDSIGDTLWTKTYGGNDWDFGYSVQICPDKGYIICGETYSYGNGLNDIYLIKTDSNGVEQWSQTYGGSDHDYGKYVDITYDGKYIVAGATKSYSVGDYDMYLLKVNTTGDTLWSNTFGGDSSDIAYAVNSNSDSTYIIAGSTKSYGAGNWDFYLMKTNINGDSVWDDVLGGPDYEEWYSVKESPDNAYIITGYSLSQIGAGGEEIFVYKVDTVGGYIQLKTYGGTEYDRGYEVINSNSGYAVVGITNSFGVGLNDAFLIKTDINFSTSNTNVTEYNDPLSIEESNHFGDINNLFTVNPNPATNFIIVDFSSLKRKYDSFYIHITNILGQDVFSKQYYNTNHLMIDISGFASGVYILSVDSLQMIDSQHRTKIIIRN